MTRNIRPRNLDVTKKLPIRRVQDVIFKEGGKIFSASSVSKGAAKEVSSSKKAFIPTPQVQKVKPGFKIRKEFKQPVHYLHFTNCTGAKVITEHDRYDLLQDDMEWLKKFNKNINGYLSEDDLELLMDFFRKTSLGRHKAGRPFWRLSALASYSGCCRALRTITCKIC
mmetsp:Transcript_39307/g.65902  ORF Transcript_39307/g.65902 Transcript_39307/m.65902 type:complete len:168 (-) Transcript_39307:1291-1794(-)